jgi:hypothetical protein
MSNPFSKLEKNIRTWKSLEASILSNVMGPCSLWQALKEQRKQRNIGASFESILSYIGLGMNLLRLY